MFTSKFPHVELKHLRERNGDRQIAVHLFFTQRRKTFDTQIGPPGTTRTKSQVHQNAGKNWVRSRKGRDPRCSLFTLVSTLTETSHQNKRGKLGATDSRIVHTLEGLNSQNVVAHVDIGFAGIMLHSSLGLRQGTRQKNTSVVVRVFLQPRHVQSRSILVQNLPFNELHLSRSREGQREQRNGKPLASANTTHNTITRQL